MLNTLSSVSVRESRIQYLCDPQWFRDTASRGPTTIAAPESQFRTCPSDHVSVRESRIQYLCDPQWFRDTASRGPTTIAAPESQFRTCPSDHVSVQYGPFSPYILIRSTTIGKSRVAIDPIAMHTSWRSNSDIASVTRGIQIRRPVILVLPG
ncbi:hypothetical protein F511_26544 [Dorcoceras hygrometricum]|uniref:Uncharacterized protein n=1 Tax=Dorcoceras hygrometricum TaxID=472368 RepID=A0A2Z7CSE0_9LAMI|nr:hypothetical protein F511_26544 [Dorcoceras hygrometricum]